MRCAFIIMSQALLLLNASVCFAAFNLKADGAEVLAWSFVGFVALFVVAQMVPACIQCIELIREALRAHVSWKSR